MPSGKTTKTATREETIAAIRAEYGLITGKLNERERRLWAAAKAIALGRGGQVIVETATGITRPTISKGCKELAAEAQAEQDGVPPEGLERGRARRLGGGRRSIAAVIVPKLDALIEPLGRRAARTKSPLRWSCQSTGQLAEVLSNVASRISERTVTTLLEHEGFTLSHNRGRKAMNREDRDRMCREICEHVRDFVNHMLPAMFVDLQRRRIASGGEGLDAGAKEIEQLDDEGLEDRAMRSNWSSTSIDRHTAEFAGRGISKWWAEIGRKRFRSARKMIVVAALSGNDRQPSKAWGAALQQVANDTRLRILRRSLPPAIYRWQSFQSRIRYLTNRATGTATHRALIGCIGQPIRGEPLREFFDSGADRIPAERRTARPTNQSIGSETAGDDVWNDEIGPE